MIRSHHKSAVTQHLHIFLHEKMTDDLLWLCFKFSFSFFLINKPIFFTAKCKKIPQWTLRKWPQRNCGILLILPMEKMDNLADDLLTKLNTRWCVLCASVHLETKIIQHSGVILHDLNYSSMKITEIVFSSWSILLGYFY